MDYCKALRRRSFIRDVNKLKAICSAREEMSCTITHDVVAIKTLQDQNSKRCMNERNIMNFNI
ncbi:CLUMA_CG003060, isoform A [Clunio marinus]|uniref:CLUMA_CG003060, isoform A n=1 Tax=Clunio marinus TaxID=568069 RepID=A0A1J1HMM4_9DIPT|nr:CLUMA_CG003060, isoform A [Clunio marinus]